MKKLILHAVAAIPLMAIAHNPIVQTCFTADPAALVVGDTVYMYTGHDENGADFFWMQEWRVYSSTDMVNWTDHGSPIALEDIDWACDRAWAAQAIERNGKYYFYFPVTSKLSGAMAIGVAVADRPEGPFKDTGAPLADGNWDFIDPTVMIDDDGQAYLYWGNPKIYYALLNDDMVSLKSDVHTIKQTIDGFGAPDPVERDKNTIYRDNYTEGPWISKRGDKYYLIYAAGGVPEHISYSMSEMPTGPWTYMGEIMPLYESGSFTNHAGVFDFKGKSYFTYHTGNLPGGGGFGRSAAIEEFEYNPDGTIPEINPTDGGVSQIGYFNPLGRVEAETMSWSQGVTTRQSDDAKVYLSDVHNGDYTKISKANFMSGNPKKFGARVASGRRGGTIEVHTDSIDGPLAARLEVPGTGGWEKWRYIEAPALMEIAGVHDIYFVFTGRKGPELFNIDYYIFE